MVGSRYHDIVRTTISIPPALLAQARRQAAKCDMTLSALLAEALRDRLEKDPAVAGVSAIAVAEEEAALPSDRR